MFYPVTKEDIFTFLPKDNVVVHLDCYKKCHRLGGILQQKFISPCSGVRKVQDKGIGRFIGW
jgi:hypothetical protein